MGMVERKHWHIVEIGKCLLRDARLLGEFWLKAFSVAIYLINRVSSKSIANKSPHQTLYKRFPNYSLFKVYGCLCYPLLLEKGWSKFDSKSIECVFIDYDS